MDLFPIDIRKNQLPTVRTNFRWYKKHFPDAAHQNQAEEKEEVEEESTFALSVCHVRLKFFLFPSFRETQLGQEQPIGGEGAAPGNSTASGTKVTGSICCNRPPKPLLAGSDGIRHLDPKI